MHHSNRAPAILLFLGSGALLAGAYAFQFIGGLHPCVLCLYQRVPHAAVLVLTLLAILAASRPPIAVWSTALAGLALLIGAGIAGFHVGVEQHWWRGTPECGGGASADTVAALRAQLLAQPVVRCDAVAWSMFGISMAGYNMLISAAMAVFALTSARRISRNGALP
jgi:disulfide bond formation protein DsbB